MNPPVRIGVIGIGYWGPNIVRSFQNSPGNEVLVICDRDGARLRRTEELFPGVRSTRDVEEVLNDSAIDAVAIATPTETHFRLSRDALLADKHVLVEKPMSTRTNEAEELVRLAATRDRILLTGHVFLYNGAVRHLKELVTEPTFGDIYYLHARRTNLGPIRKDVHAGWDLASHDLAVFLYLKEQMPRQVTASALEVIREGVPDVVFATLYFDDGTLAHLHTSWLDPQKTRDLTVVGKNKMVVFDDMDLTEPLRIYDKGFRRHGEDEKLVDTFGSFRVEVVQGDVVIPRVSTGEPLRAECQAFVEAILTGRPPLSDGRLGKDVVRLLEAMDRSIAEGSRRVSVI